MAHWDNAKTPSWEHENELAQYASMLLGYWTRAEQVGGGNVSYRRYRVEMAITHMVLEKGDRHICASEKVSCPPQHARYKLLDRDGRDWLVYLFQRGC